MIDTLQSTAMLASFARRNPSYTAQSLRRAWRVVKAMRDYKEKYKVSPWSGEPIKEVHHVVPVAACVMMGKPELAWTESNLFGMASRKEHYYLGHLGKSWHHWNRDLGPAVAVAVPMKGLAKAGMRVYSSGDHTVWVDY